MLSREIYKKRAEEDASRASGADKSAAEDAKGPRIVAVDLQEMAPIEGVKCI